MGMFVRVRVLSERSRKGREGCGGCVGFGGWAVIEVLVHHCQEALLWKPAIQKLQWGENDRRILKLGSNPEEGAGK